MPVRDMRAAVVTAPNAGFKVESRPISEPREGEVLVRVVASGVNPLDLKIAAGQAAHAQQPLPAILGLDMAGTIESIGDGVAGFKPGDEVFGMVGGVGGHQGTLAEYVVADADLVALKPKTLSMREAAALPLVAITAWEGLVDRADVHAGDRVLIHGGAGGVGHAAIQIAAALGAHVWATGRASHADIIHAAGAVFIDFETSAVAQYVSEHTGGCGFDLIYDTLGGATLDASFAAVRQFGHVVSCLGWGTHALAPLSFKGGTYSGVFTLLPLISEKGRKHHGAILSEVAKLADLGKVCPHVDDRGFTLETAGEAHLLLESRHNDGRVVVEIEGAD